MNRKKAASKANALRSEFYEATILDAAEATFAAEGFANARMQRVADRARLSVGSVYNVFSSKEALYVAVLDRRRVALMTKMHAALEVPETTFETFAEALRVHAAFSAEHPNYVRIQQARGAFWSPQSGTFTPSEIRDFKRGLAAATAVCARAIAAGELVDEDPQRMVLTMIAIYQVHIHAWMNDGFREPSAQLAARVVALFRRAFAR